MNITDLEFSYAQGAAFVIAFCMFGFLFGWASDVMSRRLVIFAGVLIWSLSTIALGFATRYEYLLLARAGIGAGEAALLPAGYSLLADAFDKSKLARAMSTLHIGAMTGSALSMLLGGYLIAHLPQAGLVTPWGERLASWQLVFIVVGAPGGVLCGAIFLASARPRRWPSASGSWAAAVGFILDNKRFYAGHMLGFSLLSLSGSAVVSWLPAYLMRNFGQTPMATGLLMSWIVVLPGVVGLFCSGRIVDYLFANNVLDAHLRYFVVVGAMQAVFMIAAMSTDNIWWLVVLISLAQLGCSYAGVASAALQIVTPDALRGRVTSIFLLLFNVIGAGLGPTLAAYSTDHIFRSDLEVGSSLALIYLIVTPLALGFLALAMKGQRTALIRADHARESYLPVDLPISGLPR